MAEMDEIQEMFFDECGELLEGLANGLRQMDQPGYDKRRSTRSFAPFIRSRVVQPHSE